MKILLTGSEKIQNRNYDKVFKILDRHAFFIKSSTVSEGETGEGYMIELDNASQAALDRINSMKNVRVL